jgi:AraC-like DNA-binding protein
MVGKAFAEHVVAPRVSLPVTAPGSEMRTARFIGFCKDVAVPTRRRELPTQTVNLLVHFEQPLALPRDSTASRLASSFVVGMRTASTVTERFGRQHGVHVELSPLAARAVFGVPMHLLTDSLVDLPDLLGRDAERLVEKLATAGTWRERFATLHDTLAARVLDTPGPSPLVAWAWGRLRATHGSVRIEELVSESGYSHRYLIARFRDEIGVTPKTLARVLRFERSVDLVRRSRTSLTETALTAGYYDQAHFNREIRALTGCAPGVLFGTVAGGTGG